MTAIAFDTLKFSRHLKAAGVIPAHAEAEAEALAEVLAVNLKDLASKDDVVRETGLLRRDMREMEDRMETRFTQVDAKFAQLEDRMDAKFAQVDAKFAQLEERMDARFAQVDAKFAQQEERFDFKLVQLEQRIVIKLGALMAFGIGVVATLVKLF